MAGRLQWHRGMRDARPLGVAAVLVSSCLIGVSGLEAAIVQRSITVDGDMLDWAPVLVSPQNYVSDPSVEQGDPDMPSSSDRDMRAFAVTWDATDLFFYFRRTFSGNNSITYLV